MPKKHISFTALSFTGDDVLKFDPTNPEDVEKARTTFNDMLGKGFEAFTVGSNPTKVTDLDQAVEAAKPAMEITCKPKPKGGCVTGKQSSVAVY